MTTMTSLEDRRLGLVRIVSEHVATWTTAQGRPGRHARWRAACWFYGVPGALAAPFVFVHFKLSGIGQLLAGVTVFTALLFGLLMLIFNTGVTLRRDSSTIANAHGLRELVSDLRANTTYAIVVGFALAAVLVVAAATTAPPSSVTGSDGMVAWQFTPVVTWLFAHLALTLMTVLRRFRTAFNLITR